MARRRGGVTSAVSCIREHQVKTLLIDNTKRVLEHLFPGLLYLIYYYKGYRMQRHQWVAQAPLFAELIAVHRGKMCLQIGARNEKYSADFVCADLYDQASYVDFHYDIHQLGFEDGVFDLVVCNAVLEHVVDPVRAIAELGRVLKEGGQIWVEVPFNQPYHPCPGDFWRVSVPGLESWMAGFRKINSGIFGGMIYNGVFFHGMRDSGR